MAEVVLDRVTEARRILGAFGSWMLREEAALRRLYDALALQVALGIAPCPEVQSYNRDAAFFYSWANQIALKARIAGIQVVAPTFPSLFAHDIRTNAAGDIVADFICDAAGFVSPSGIRTQAPCGASPIGQGLGFGPSAACVLAPWSCGVLIAFQAVAIGGVLYVGLEMGRKLANAFTDAEMATIDAQARQQTHAADANRVEKLNDCVSEGIKLVPNPTLEQWRQVRATCDVSIGKAVPDRGNPETQASRRWAFWLGATALVGAVATAIYFARRPTTKHIEPPHEPTPGVAGYLAASAHTIVYETTAGYVTRERTGKSESYIVWVHGAVAATRRHTFGVSSSDALARAKAALDAHGRGGVASAQA